MQKLSRRRVASYAAGQLAKKQSPMKLANYLAAYLVESKQVAQVELLIKDIEAVLAAKHNVVTADVMTARPLSEALRTSIRTLVTNTHGAAEVIINESVEPELIGGLAITTPNGHFDGSVRKKLQHLQAMKNKEI